MSGSTPSLGRALAVPLLLAIGLSALLLRPHHAAERPARPPLPTPVVLDELVPQSQTVPVAEPGVAPASAEGLRGWGTH